MLKTKLINFSIIGHVIGGIILILGKKSWFPDFYWPEFMGVFAFLSAFLIISPNLFIKPSDKNKLDVIKNLQLFFAFALVLNSLGGLGFFQLYKYGFEYDKLVHFIVPLSATMIIAQLIGAWKKIEFKKILAITFITVMLMGVTWEFLEFLSDLILKSKSFGVYGEYLVKDTAVDILFNTLGIISGIIILIKNKRLPKINL